MNIFEIYISVTDAYGIIRKNKKLWHRLFSSLIERALVIAYVTYRKVTASRIPSMEFRRNVTLSLITLEHPPKVGWALHLASPPVCKKQKRSDYIVPDTVCLQNHGVHWVEFRDKQQGQCEVCLKNKIVSSLLSFSHTCKVTLYCNKGKNCFTNYHDL